MTTLAIVAGCVGGAFAYVVAAAVALGVMRQLGTFKPKWREERYADLDRRIACAFWPVLLLIVIAERSFRWPFTAAWRLGTRLATRKSNLPRAVAKEID